METKFTPGPWNFSTEPQPNGCPIIGNDKGLMVAMLAHSVNNPEHRETALANAHLIAASPELYEALESARDVLLNIDGDYLSSSANKEINEEIERIDKILLKARGENTNQFTQERQNQDETV